MHNNSTPISARTGRAQVFTRAVTPQSECGFSRWGLALLHSNAQILIRADVAEWPVSISYLPPQKNQRLGRNACTCVQNYILPSPGSRRKKTLVPFVEAGYESRPQNRDGCPAGGPLGIRHRRQGDANRAEKQNAQGRIAYNMSALSNVEMPALEALPIQMKQEVQHWIENPAGVMRGKQRCRFDGNHDEPQDRGDPGYQDTVPVRIRLPGVQLRGLLDAIVGRLAGNHHIVDVAFAKSRAADAHKTRFLEQLSDGGAPAVAHTRSQPAHHLMHDHGDRSTIRDTPLDAFRHKLPKPVGVAVV
jgi:hypothetical protein